MADGRRRGQEEQVEGDTGVRRRRAAEKDDHCASYIHDACRDAIRHLFGTRTAVAFQNETKLMGQMLYYLLTTCSGQQTLGEEYCDLAQMLPFVHRILQLVLRANLMLFYFEGLYYHISKRAAGIRYVFLGKPLNRRPRYQILGVFLLIQLCIIGVEGLRKTNISSITNSVQRTSVGSYYTTPGLGVPVLNEDGNLITESTTGKGKWSSISLSSSEPQGYWKMHTTSQHQAASDSYSLWPCLLLELRYGMVQRET